MNDQESVETYTPEIEAEGMSESEAQALRDQGKAMSLDELHVSMSNVYRRAHRGHLDRSRAAFLLWAGRQVKDVAQAVSERDDRLAERREIAQLRERVEQVRGDSSGLPALSYADTDGDLVVDNGGNNDHDSNMVGNGQGTEELP